MHYVRLTLLLPVLALLIGCSSEDEQLYSGMPLSVWGQRLESTDPSVRADALDIIAGIGTSARGLEEKVRTIARVDQFNDIRMLAIEALQAMGAPVVEFNEFVKLYNAPLFGSDSLDALDRYDLDGMDDIAEPVDDYSAENVFNEKLSGDDDLSFLTDMAEGILDSLHSDSLEKARTVISSPEEMQDYSSTQQRSQIETLMKQIANPRVLADILENGSRLDKVFAAGRLAELTGEDDRVMEVLETASSDSDSLVRSLVGQALKNWKLP